MDENKVQNRLKPDGVHLLEVSTTSEEDPAVVCVPSVHVETKLPMVEPLVPRARPTSKLRTLKNHAYWVSRVNKLASRLPLTQLRQFAIDYRTPDIRLKHMETKSGRLYQTLEWSKFDTEKLEAICQAMRVRIYENIEFQGKREVQRHEQWKRERKREKCVRLLHAYYTFRLERLVDSLTKPQKSELGAFARHRFIESYIFAPTPNRQGDTEALKTDDMNLAKLIACIDKAQELSRQMQGKDKEENKETKVKGMIQEYVKDMFTAVCHQPPNLICLPGSDFSKYKRLTHQNKPKHPPVAIPS